MFARATLFTTLAAALFSTASAGKTPDGVFDGDKGVTLIDYQPPFTSPTGGEIWFAGFNYSASWSQTLPSDISLENVSQTADLKLGYLNEEDSTDTSLHLEWTLATGIELYNEGENSVDFQLPADLKTHQTYFLVLLGSTNHQSPQFTVISNPLAALGLGAGSSGSSAGSTLPSSAGSNSIIPVSSLPPFPTPAAPSSSSTTTTPGAAQQTPVVAESASRELFRQRSVGRVRKVRRSTFGAGGKLRQAN
ncbi:hypothetical protein JCM8097_000494 [Rhodosporidiobolus ruineniae]